MSFHSSGAHVFICGDDYDLAGFAFLLKGSVVKPVARFQSDGFIECSIESMLSDIEKQHGINELIVPAVPAGETNKLLKLMPKGYQSREAKTDPSFAECSARRAVAINDSEFDETGYKGSDKLLERLRQVREDKPATVVLWAYLRGLYELLEGQRSNTGATIVMPAKKQRPPVSFGHYSQGIARRRILF